jgi:hypothetical protein
MKPYLLTSALFAVFFSHASQAQPSSCSSDGVKLPATLIERFISADCEACWAATSASALPQNQLALDWIVPSPKGEDAPLYAAINRDASARIERLQKNGLLPAQLNPLANQTAQRITRNALPPAISLRVAIGQAVNGYIGTSVELRGVRASHEAQLQKLLGSNPRVGFALVENIPAGAEGSAIERNLVRNMLWPAWNLREQLSKNEQANQKRDPMIGRAFFEFRPMSIAEGAQSSRLRVVAWLEDKQGNMLIAATSACKS